MFDPRPTKYPFPEYTDSHYLIVKKNDGTVFDAAYPYVDKTPSFMRKRKLFNVLLRLIVFPLTRLRLGLKVKGRENLDKYADELKNGAVLCSNHVHLWDFLAIRSALLPHKPYVLIWAPNVRGENGKNMRLIGGIPIPDTGPAATSAQLKAIDGLLDSGDWLQIYSEGSMWEFYQPIRPFKRGTAYIARRSDKPLLPMAFSYREPGWIRKHIFRQTALFTLNIGTPLYADPSLLGKDADNDLCARSHDAVCRLAGIDPADNIYPPVFNKTRRVDYY